MADLSWNASALRDLKQITEFIAQSSPYPRSCSQHEQLTLLVHAAMDLLQREEERGWDLT